MKVRLNHFCHLPGMEGQPGDVIDVTPEQAKRLFDIKGAVPHAPKPERAVAPPPESRAAKGPKGGPAKAGDSAPKAPAASE